MVKRARGPGGRGSGAVVILAALVWIIPGAAFPQKSPEFSINLQFNYAAAEECIRLYGDEFVSTRALSELRGNLIAASTAGLIANRRDVPSLLKSYLDSLRNHQQITGDVYHLEDARRGLATIRELLAEIKKRNLSQRIAATVGQLFPREAVVSCTIPVYVVAFGHENADAYVRRILWKDDVPSFTGGESGELTIVINLAASVRYGSNTEERLLSLLTVMAHEVFHAAFGVYKETSPFWKRYYLKYSSPFDALLDITQNEGIAYYLSLDQEWRGNLPPEWPARTKNAVAAFNSNASELLSPRIARERASELLRRANLSGYWESFGSMTGMLIAREIDLRLGRPALIETVERGPADFFSKYIRLTEEDSNLPKLKKLLESEIGARL